MIHHEFHCEEDGLLYRYKYDFNQNVGLMPQSEGMTVTDEAEGSRVKRKHYSKQGFKPQTDSALAVTAAAAAVNPERSSSFRIIYSS